MINPPDFTPAVQASDDEYVAITFDSEEEIHKLAYWAKCRQPLIHGGLGTLVHLNEYAAERGHGPLAASQVRVFRQPAD